MKSHDSQDMAVLDARLYSKKTRDNLRDTSSGSGILLPVSQVYGSHQYDVERYVDKMILNHQVVLFSKTYCQYSKKMKRLLDKYNISDKKILELDLEPDMQLMQDHLKRRSGGVRTVPQLYVDGQFIGGFDVTERKEQNGELEKVFSRVGITSRKSSSPIHRRKCMF